MTESQQWEKLGEELQQYPEGTKFFVADMGMSNVAAILECCQERSKQSGSLMFEGEEQLDRCTLPYETEKSRSHSVSAKSIIDASGAPARENQQRRELEAHRKVHPGFVEAENLVNQHSLKTSDPIA